MAFRNFFISEFEVNMMKTDPFGRGHRSRVRIKSGQTDERCGGVTYHSISALYLTFY